MMQYVIIDATVKYANANHPLQQSLFYAGSANWVRSFEKAVKYNKIEEANKEASKLNAELPVKLMQVG